MPNDRRDGEPHANSQGDTMNLNADNSAWKSLSNVSLSQLVSWAVNKAGLPSETRALETEIQRRLDAEYQRGRIEG
jgi:hypothetical protein